MMMNREDQWPNKKIIPQSIFLAKCKKPGRQRMQSILGPILRTFAFQSVQHELRVWPLKRATRKTFSESKGCPSVSYVLEIWLMEKKNG